MSADLQPENNFGIPVLKSLLVGALPISRPVFVQHPANGDTSCAVSSHREVPAETVLVDPAEVAAVIGLLQMHARVLKTSAARPASSTGLLPGSLLPNHELFIPDIILAHSLSPRLSVVFPSFRAPPLLFNYIVQELWHVEKEAAYRF